MPLKMKLPIFQGPERIWEGKFKKNNNNEENQNQTNLKIYPSNRICLKKGRAAWWLYVLILARVYLISPACDQ